jgi:FolB domain-containing protein
MNKIIIDGLKANCVIGIKPAERLKPQEVIIDLSLSLDLSKAFDTDDIEDTVDYDTLVGEITKFVENSRFELLEKLAYEVAKLTKENSNAKEVKVTVKKPSALKNVNYVATEVAL